MLRIIESFGHKPVKVSIDRNIDFQPGQIISLKIKNKDTILDICDGLYPYGIVDDLYSKSLRHVVFSKKYYLSDAKELNSKLNFIQLPHSNIIKSSFDGSFSTEDGNIYGILSFADVNLKTGKITFPKKLLFTELLISYAANDINNHIYDTTISDNNASVWTNNIIIETDMFDTSKKYYLYNNLYVESGFLTTKISNESCKCIGTVLRPPTQENPLLKYLYDLEGNVNIGNG